MIVAVIRKEVALLLRERGALISLFALPVVFILVFGSVFSSQDDPDRERVIAVWHAPDDPRGSAIAAMLGEAPGFAPRVVATVEAVDAAVADGDAAAGLVVPTDRDVPVQLVIDLAAPLQVRGPIQGALVGVVMRASLPANAPAAAVATRSPHGLAAPVAEASAFQVAVPANAVLFGFFIALTVAMAFTTERRTGTWRRLLAAPVSRRRAVLAMLVPYALVGLVQLGFLFATGALVFGMQIAGSFAALVAVSLAIVYCAVTLGLVMASLGGSERQLGGIGSVVLLVMGIVGGCMVPRMAMPPIMKTLGLAVPHGWALDAYYDVLVREGTTLASVTPEIGALLAFGTGFALLAVALFRFE